MSIFSRDKKKPQSDPNSDEYNFDFSVLWQDEEESKLLSYILPVIIIILQVWVLIKL